MDNGGDVAAQRPKGQRLDTMKKQNKIYLSLKDQGIKKAWDKVIIFKSIDDDERENYEMAALYRGRPFVYWSVKDVTDFSGLRISLYGMIDYYERLDIGGRKNSKRVSKYFLDRAFMRIATFTKHGGIIYPSLEG